MLLRGATGCATGGRRAAIALRFALFAAFAVMQHPSRAEAQAQQDAQTLADQAIHRLDLQRKLLADQAIRKLDLQTELQHPAEPETHKLNLPPETVWVAVIVGVIVLLYILRDMIPALRAGRGGSTWAEDETGAFEIGSRPPEVVLGAADDLAAQGRFVEAMHVLLLQALADIRRRLDEQFADSMTSREILRSGQVSNNLRRPLREVISRVEWTYFGGHPASRDDYLACRASFSALAQALSQGAAA